MTREEAKAFLTDISYDLGTIGIMEYSSVKDGKKMRDAIETLWQELTTNNEMDEVRQAYDNVIKQDAVETEQEKQEELIEGELDYLDGVWVW